VSNVKIKLFSEFSKNEMEKYVNLFEKKIANKLPSDYRIFLINYNGGSPHPDIFTIKTKSLSISVRYFFGLGEIPDYYSLDFIFKISRGDMPMTQIPIGEDNCGNYICISVSKKDYGKMYFWDHDTNEIYLVENNFKEFIESLKEYNCKTGNAIEDAIICGDIQTVKEFIKNKINMNYVNENNYTLVDLAAYHGKLDILQFLHEKGASINNAIFYSVTHEPILKYLIENNVDVNSVNKKDETPLYLALLQGNINCVKYLLEHGADPNNKSEGQTPLFLTVIQENMNCMKVLLDHGADPNIEIEGDNILDIVVGSY
jgi:hypothetical protein